jgi:hypothetical protein
MNKHNISGTRKSYKITKYKLKLTVLKNIHFEQETNGSESTDL